MSNVIAFPGPRDPDSDWSAVALADTRACDQCIHFMSGYLGQYCRAYEEDIFSVHEAADCEQYEQA